MSDNLHFHYKRQERLAMPGAPGKPPRGGFLKGNRGMVFLLIDVILIVAAVYLYKLFVTTPSYRGEVGGYSVSLRGIPAGDDVLAVLDVRAPAEGSRAGRVFVVFTAGDAEVRTSEPTPAPSQSASLSVRLIAAGAAREVRAEVSLGTQTVVLRRDLDRG